MARRLLVLLTLTLLMWAPRARAQGGDVTATLSSDVVEVGEPFVLEMRAMTEGDVMPSDPALRAPKGFQLSGPRISTRSMAQFGGGRSVVQRGIGATWQLVASTPGTFTIPNPTVVIGGQTVTAYGSLRVKVVAAGSKPPSTSPFASPFPRSPLGGMFRFPFPSDSDFGGEADDIGELPEEARKLALKREPDQYVFVRLVPDKDSAVVGEQVTLSYYVYYRTDLQLTVQREPALADFLRVPIEKAPGTEEAIITSVGDYRYHVKLLDRVAVFPLRAGDLKTGVIFTKFTGNRFAGKELERTSNEVTVVVTEPPVEGRPAGYRLGDVGKYSLAVDVAPKEIRVGETVAVEVRLSGRGSLPTALKIPERTGVEWLDPERKEEIEVENGNVGGWRLFRYAVRVSLPGEMDLGAIELPYFDNETGKYETARAELGDLKVLPGANGDTPDKETDEDPFASLAKPRQGLQEYDATGDRGFNPMWLWVLVLVPPIGVALTGFVWSMSQRMRNRRREREKDPAVLARRALGELGPKPDPKDSAAAAERALHFAIEAATGVKSRAVLMDELAPRLEQAGLDAALVSELMELFDWCSTLRFDPSPEQSAADRIVARTPSVVQKLLRTRPRPKTEAKAA